MENQTRKHPTQIGWLHRACFCPTSTLPTPCALHVSTILLCFFFPQSKLRTKKLFIVWFFSCCFFWGRGVKSFYLLHILTFVIFKFSLCTYIFFINCLIIFLQTHVFKIIFDVNFLSQRAAMWQYCINQLKNFNVIIRVQYKVLCIFLVLSHRSSEQLGS